MLEKLKEHPWIIAVLVGVFLVVLLFSSRGTSTTASDTGTADSSQAANNYNNAQQQIAAGLSIAQMQSGVQSQQIAGAVTVAQLQAGVADNANTLAAQVAEYTTAAGRDVAINHDTLTAQVAEANTKAQLQAIQSNNLASTTNTTTLANALVAQNQIASATAQHLSDNQTAVSVNAANNQAATFANYINVLPTLEASHDNAQVAVAQAARPCSSYLFGLISDC